MKWISTLCYSQHNGLRAYTEPTTPKNVVKKPYSQKSVIKNAESSSHLLHKHLAHARMINTKLLQDLQLVSTESDIVLL